MNIIQKSEAIKAGLRKGFQDGSSKMAHRKCYVLIFLISGMEASQNSMYNTGDFNDAIRKGYVSGKKSYNNLKQVRKDFDIWEMDYLVGYVTCIVFVIIMAICIFTFIVRMFNLLLLYITAPLFVSSMPLDDGGKWQSWTQAFVIQLFSGFGMIIAMRLYLIIIPIVISSDLVFFVGKGLLHHSQQTTWCQMIGNDLRKKQEVPLPLLSWK